MAPGSTDVALHSLTAECGSEVPGTVTESIHVYAINIYAGLAACPLDPHIDIEDALLLAHHDNNDKCNLDGPIAKRQVQLCRGSQPARWDTMSQQTIVESLQDLQEAVLNSLPM